MTARGSSSGVWTDERIAQLRNLFAGGLSASQIAAELGVTRNAVIGKVNRLGLSGRGNRPGPAKGSKLTAPRMKAKPGTVGSQAYGMIHGIKRRQRAATAPAPIIPDAMAPISQRLSLLELNSATCHWPIGDPSHPEFFFCGGKALPSLPYCAHHSRLAYQPRQARRGLSLWERL